MTARPMTLGMTATIRFVLLLAFIALGSAAIALFEHPLH